MWFVFQLLHHNAQKMWKGLYPFFIKGFWFKFVIIAVYDDDDDLNIIASPKEIQKSVDYLKERIWNKRYWLIDWAFSKWNICPSINLYWENSEMIYMDKEYPLSTSMVVRSLDIDKDWFQPHENDKELLGPEIPYLSAIGTLLYLTKNTRTRYTFFYKFGSKIWILSNKRTLEWC